MFLAVNPDPDFRPKLTVMVNDLGDCLKEFIKEFSSSTLSDSGNSYPLLNQNCKSSKPKRTYSIDQDDKLPDLESFNYMSLAEAEKQHRMCDKYGNAVGEIKAAYKCFEAYAALNQIKAKYYKAYYILKDLIKLDEAGIDPKEKDKIVAELFREVADDDEANEFPEAKLRYGDCLYNGRGVERNLPEALKYFEKAADNGLKVAMYNVGNLYYKGSAGEQDIEKATHYMRLAVYNKYAPAIKFCEDHNIPL